jgi:ABC-type uncharacterized transport system fused permease/ATPase subunit
MKKIEGKYRSNHYDYLNNSERIAFYNAAE